MEKETFDGNDIEVTETETSEQQVSEETEKPHKWRKPLLITLGGIAGTTAAVYIGTAAYFYFHCLPNTEINGKDFSYANRAEIEDYLTKKVGQLFKRRYKKLCVGDKRPGKCERSDSRFGNRC